MLHKHSDGEGVLWAGLAPLPSPPPSHPSFVLNPSPIPLRSILSLFSSLESEQPRALPSILGKRSHIPQQPPHTLPLPSTWVAFSLPLLGDGSIHFVFLFSVLGYFKRGCHAAIPDLLLTNK